MSGAVTRFIGASRYSNAFSLIMAAISAPMPAVLRASCNISTFPVFLAVANIDSLSNGDIVRKSITSHDMLDLVNVLDLPQFP